MGQNVVPEKEAKPAAAPPMSKVLLQTPPIPQATADEVKELKPGEEVDLK